MSPAQRLIDSRREEGRAAVLPEFQNEPLTDFSKESNRRAFASALEKTEARLPIEGKNRIGGVQSGRARTFESVNPSRRSQVIGRFPEGTREDGEQAVEAAAMAFSAWSRRPAERTDHKNIPSK